MPVSTTITISAQAHCGTAGTQPVEDHGGGGGLDGQHDDQKNQYSQPMEKPAQRPSARSA